MSPIFRILYRLYRLFSWFRYFGQRRFTRAGLLVLCSLGLAAIMVPDTDNNLAYQAFALLFFLLVLSMSFGWFFRGQFSAERALPRFGTAGAELQYSVILKNLTRSTQSGLALLEDFADPRPSFQEWLAVQLADERRMHALRFSSGRQSNPFRLAAFKDMPVPDAAPGQQVEVPMRLVPLRRGVLRLNGVTVARSDPLGLYRALRKVMTPQSLIVLPKRYPLPPIALPGQMKYQQGGVALASNVGQSEEFVALRDYRHGDPLRHIHWRSWAKTGKPVVKEFEDEFFVRHALVLDTFTDQPHGEAFEEAVAVAASFACSIQTQESLLDLLFVGAESYCFTAGRGLAQADQMLEILAAVRACGDKAFATLEHLVLQHVSVVSGCICVFLAWDQARRRFIEELQALGVPVLVLIVVEPRQIQGLEPGPMQAEPERFRILECGQIEEGLSTLK
jgi:uncharacterized protein (DUF58 family)